MNLLRFRSTVRTVRLELPNGDHRAVKVTTNEIGTVQHVTDGDHLHGTGKPITLEVRVNVPAPQRRAGGLLRNLGMPRARQAFHHDFDTGLWAPVHLKERYE